MLTFKFPAWQFQHQGVRMLTLKSNWNQSDVDCYPHSVPHYYKNPMVSSICIRRCLWLHEFGIEGVLLWSAESCDCCCYYWSLMCLAVVYLLLAEVVFFGGFWWRFSGCLFRFVLVWLICIDESSVLYMCSVGMRVLYPWLLWLRCVYCSYFQFVSITNCVILCFS